MGLVTRRNDKLEKLFDGFTVDPSKLKSAHKTDKKDDKKASSKGKDKK